VVVSQGAELHVVALSAATSALRLPRPPPAGGRLAHRAPSQQRSQDPPQPQSPTSYFTPRGGLERTEEGAATLKEDDGAAGRKVVGRW
jgi:hypothetical protein